MNVMNMNIKGPWMAWLWIWEGHEWHEYEYERAMNGMTMNMRVPWMSWLWIWKGHEYRDYEYESAMNAVIWTGNVHEYSKVGPMIYEFQCLILVLRHLFDMQETAWVETFARYSNLNYDAFKYVHRLFCKFPGIVKVNSVACQIGYSMFLKTVWVKPLTKKASEKINLKLKESVIYPETNDIDTR